MIMRPGLLLEVGPTHKGAALMHCHSIGQKLAKLKARREKILRIIAKLEAKLAKTR
jgi:hypothetical protein